jgi:hypothetical protein
VTGAFTPSARLYPRFSGIGLASLRLTHSPFAAGLEDAEAAWRQADVHGVTGRKVEAVDAAVEHQCRDGRVAAQGDAGERPGADNSFNVPGRDGVRCAQTVVFRGGEHQVLRRFRPANLGLSRLLGRQIASR